MKAVFRAQPQDALALFARAPVVHVAAVDHAGRPIARTLHGVVVDGRIAFHGGEHGDKLDMLGHMAMATAEEHVAEIPSYFLDPERACPATSYYLSAWARGRVHRVTDMERKAAILRAFMARFQPEGGHAPIDATDPRYTRELAGLMVAELVPEELAAKHKLGQNRSRAQIERVMACLWQRGRTDDLRAIRLIRDAHPARPRPAFLHGPGEIELCCAPDEADAHEVAALLAPQYWNQGAAPESIARAQLGSSAWVVARRAGRVVGTARAISDGARHATIHDVAVVPDAQGTGVGKALVALLLSHPRLRACENVQLNTRDAQPFYAPLGFVEVECPYATMSLRR